jgi:hypothetical protein
MHTDNVAALDCIIEVQDDFPLIIRGEDLVEGCGPGGDGSMTPEDESCRFLVVEGNV